MTLIKTSLLNCIAVAIRLFTFLGINKLLSFYVGPVGYAFLGQYQNLITVVTTLASGAINTGVTKYTAEYYDDASNQHVVWQTAAKIALIGSVFTSLLLALFRRELALVFLDDTSLSGVFLWFAATLILFVMNSLLLAILNGKKEIIRYVFSNIIGSLLALIITALLVIYYNLYGALVALAVYQSVTFFVTGYLCHKAAWFRWSYLIGKLDSKIAKKLLQYALMALVAAICAPGVQVLVRRYIGTQISWGAAGYIEAMWRVSAAYLMIITTTLSVYFIPKLSELSDPKEIKTELINAYKILVPFTMICSTLIYLLRKVLTKYLFTEEFIGMEELFAWQMIGDSIKVCSWILMYLYMAKNFFYLYVFSELFFSATFYLLVVILEQHFGLRSVAIGHAFNYLMYFSFGLSALKLKRVI